MLKMGNLIVKDNALIEASHKLGEAEQRLLLLAIVKGREFCDSVEQLRGKELTIHADDYIQTFKVDKSTAYRVLRKAVVDLYRAEWGYKYINSKGESVVAYERFTQSAKYIERGARVKFRFADAIIPMLVELERRFTTYELGQVANLQSRYAMRLYEFLIRFKTSKTLEITLADLRFRFGLLDSEYSRMGDFKKRVLEQAIEEINEYTDISVKYEQTKQGRTITGFTFKFEYKDKPKAKQKQLEQQQRDENTADMFTKLTDKQLARAVHSKKFIADYNGLVSAQNPANQSSGAWVAHMVEWLKKDPATFNKRPMQEYLDDEQAPRF